MEDEIDLETFWNALVRGKYVISLFVFLGLLFGINYIRTATPIYVADVVIQLNEENRNQSKDIDGVSLIRLLPGAILETLGS